MNGQINVHCLNQLYVGESQFENLGFIKNSNVELNVDCLEHPAKVGFKTSEAFRTRILNDVNVDC